MTCPGWESGPVCTNLLCSTVTYVLTFALPKPLGLCLTSVAWLALCIWVPLVVSLSGSPVSLFPRAGEGPFLLLLVSYMQQAHWDPLVEGVTHLGMNILSILAARLPAAQTARVLSLFLLREERALSPGLAKCCCDWGSFHLV